MGEPLTWQGRRIAAPEHAADLEMAAAVKQFTEHKRQPEAESAAHAAYTRSQALDAAAHHLAGIRAAHAGGWDDPAREHAEAYAAAAQQAGFDPHGEPPKEVLDRLASLKPLYRFKAHPADQLWERPEAQSLDAPVTASPATTAASAAST